MSKGSMGPNKASGLTTTFQKVTGFASFSDLAASDSEHSSFIFKRYDNLASRDLLYYQSELAELQLQQEKYDYEDAQDVSTNSSAWEDIRTNTRHWPTFVTNSTAGEQRWKDRMELAMKIRHTLKEYRQALLEEAQLLSLSTPSNQSMTAISSLFHRPGYSVLSGASSKLYPDPREKGRAQDEDYITLSSQTGTDALTYFLQTHCTWLFRIRFSHHDVEALPYSGRPSQLVHYSMARVKFTAYLISILLAASLLFFPIYSLSHVSKARPNLKMGLIALFTLLFAATVALVSTARRGEIFGASAAYAAVLVVFVSSDFGP